jgi:hypothetical protein
MEIGNDTDRSYPRFFVPDCAESGYLLDVGHPYDIGDADDKALPRAIYTGVTSAVSGTTSERSISRRL